MRIRLKPEYLLSLLLNAPLVYSGNAPAAVVSNRRVGSVNGATLTPYYENSALRGFQVVSIGSMSPFKLFEIKPNDILIQSNGVALDSTSALQKMLGGDLAHHSITVLRDGKEIKLGKENY